MNTRAWRSLERELRDAGFAAAATDGLRARLEKGEPGIDVTMGHRFGQDDVRVTLHLQKSHHGDSYELSSFDLQLRKAGNMDWMQQHFQQSGGPYTLQEAYNLLAGRAVYKHIGAPGEKPYDVWLRLDFDRKLNNGNYANKYYHREDGFDLATVLGRYPIRELGDARQRKDLIGVLHRGDLAAVTFDGVDGTERKLFITPSIPTRSLLAQDENGIRVSPEKLAQGAVSNVDPVKENSAVRLNARQIGERQPVQRRGKRQRLS
jgi:hypothetical protein